ncbi:hypothetical protein AB5J52_42425 [Streptomyces sp. R39]|uniref:Uncharacterized protein n=1 Tax=Streptomyces sp. R39 TaxID=3238631 RepID=A0AB39R428_9ACTN
MENPDIGAGIGVALPASLMAMGAPGPTATGFLAAGCFPPLGAPRFHRPAPLVSHEAQARA